MKDRGQQKKKGTAVEELNRVEDVVVATCCAPDTLGRELDVSGECESLNSTLFDH